MSTRTRDRLHRLIDELPEQDLPAVEELLANRCKDDHLFLRKLTEAPEDDEPLTAEEETALREGIDALERGELASHAEVRAELDAPPPGHDVPRPGAARKTLRQRLAEAPIDDEPLTPEDVAALDEAYEDIAAGRVFSDEELWRRLGHASPS